MKELSRNDQFFFSTSQPLSGVFQLLSILKSRFDHSSTTMRTNILTLNTILLPSLGPFFRTLNSDETKSICGFLGRYQVKAFVKPIFYIIALPKIRWESKRLWKRPKRPLAVMWSRKRFFQCSQLWPLKKIGRKGFKPPLCFFYKLSIISDLLKIKPNRELVVFLAPC